MRRSLSFRPGGPQTRVRLEIEPLESRDLPSTFGLGDPVQVSGPSPFADCTNLGLGLNVVNFESEPMVAVDPANADHIVSAWLQDDARGFMAGVSFNGGTTWQPAAIPPLTVCNGGPYHFVGNVWVSFAANGDLYLAGIGDPNDTVVILKSTDGGLSWGDPIVLISDGNRGFLNDKETITTDPTNANYAYVTWCRFPSGCGEDQTMLARTTDGGRTWEPARTIYRTHSSGITNGQQILVEPDGTLVLLFTETVRQGADKMFLTALRSTDKGATWSEPIRAAEMQGALVTDADTGFRVVSATTFTNGSGPKIITAIPSVAVDPHNGWLYAVWEDARYSNGLANGIAFSMSTDGGLNWSAPVRINQTPTNIPVANQQAFLPSIHVAANGVVGVTYYDFRNNTPASSLPTDYFFVHADPGSDLTKPAAWAQENRLTKDSFNMEQAPVDPIRNGYFVGAYEGLASRGNDFVPVWSMPHPVSGGMIDLGSIFTRRVIAGAPLAAVFVGLNTTSAMLTSSQVGSLLSEAIRRWQAAGVDTSALAGIDIRIADLGGTTLGLASGNTIWLDDNAAGWGWFVDPTPGNDSEFTTSGNQGEQNRMDLLPVLEDEVGLLLGRITETGAS